MRLCSIQVGMPKTYGDPMKKSLQEREWTTGFYKSPVLEDVEVTRLGIVGDGQGDLTVHGGPDKAVCVYPMEHYKYWEDSLGLKMSAGAFGENFTIADGLESGVCIGDSYQIDDVIFQVTQPRQPCWKLSRRWKTKNLTALVQDTGKTGWYFRVLKGGKISPSNEICLLDRAHEGWTIDVCNEVMHHAKADLERAFTLAQIPELSESWQLSLLKRVERKKLDS